MFLFFFFFQAEDGIRDTSVTGVQTCALPISRFPIKQASIAVVLSGLEGLQNRGEEEMMDLIETRVDTAEDTFWNQMSASIYSDGTGFGGKQLNGLAL